MIWGVNGHPLMRVAYRNLGGLETQFSYLDSLQVGYYRVDVQVDTLRGDVKQGGIPSTTLLDIADRHHIKILPVLTNTPAMSDLRGRDMVELNYRAGRRLGHTLAAIYGNRVPAIEAGNELDIVALPSGAEGSSPSQYDSTKLAWTVAFLRGMTRGIRAAAPRIKIIINTAGWRHYAFFDALRRDSVDYDIVGYHWYSEMGDIDAPIRGGESVLDHLAALGKDIWITEFNRRGGSRGEASDEDQAHSLARYIRQFHKLEPVKALFVYELYDEYEFGDDLESFYGLIRCSTGDATCLGPKALKPGFDTFRYGIEELAHGYEDYVYRLFTRLVHRAPTSPELMVWTNRFIDMGRSGHASRVEFVGAFLQENSAAFIGDLYRRLVEREPTADAIAYWHGRMSDGSLLRDVTAGLCGSAEFWDLSGATSEGFINRLYQLLLRREPGPNDTRSYTNGPLAQWERQEIINSILDSREAHAVFIGDEYRTLLGREPTEEERARDIARMRNGLTREDLIVDLLRSTEFWNAAVTAGYWRRVQGFAGPDLEPIR